MPHKRSYFKEIIWTKQHWARWKRDHYYTCLPTSKKPTSHIPDSQSTPSSVVLQKRPQLKTQAAAVPPTCGKQVRNWHDMTFDDENAAMQTAASTLVEELESGPTLENDGGDDNLSSDKPPLSCDELHELTNARDTLVLENQKLCEANRQLASQVANMQDYIIQLESHSWCMHSASHDPFIQSSADICDGWDDKHVDARVTAIERAISELHSSICKLQDGDTKPDWLTRVSDMLTLHQHQTNQQVTDLVHSLKTAVQRQFGNLQLQINEISDRLPGTEIKTDLSLAIVKDDGSGAPIIDSMQIPASDTIFSYHTIANSNNGISGDALLDTLPIPASDSRYSFGDVTPAAERSVTTAVPDAADMAIGLNPPISTVQNPSETRAFVGSFGKNVQSSYSLLGQSRASGDSNNQMTMREFWVVAQTIKAARPHIQTKTPMLALCDASSELRAQQARSYAEEHLSEEERQVLQMTEEEWESKMYSDQQLLAPLYPEIANGTYSTGHNLQVRDDYSQIKSSSYRPEEASSAGQHLATALSGPDH